MDFITKKLVDKSAAYSQAFSELIRKDNTINHVSVQYIDGSGIFRGKFVRAYHPQIGYSSKYFYE